MKSRTIGYLLRERSHLFYQCLECGEYFSTHRAYSLHDCKKPYEEEGATNATDQEANHIGYEDSSIDEW